MSVASKPSQPDLVVTVSLSCGALRLIPYVAVFGVDPVVDVAELTGAGIARGLEQLYVRALRGELNAPSGPPAFIRAMSKKELRAFQQHEVMADVEVCGDKIRITEYKKGRGSAHSCGGAPPVELASRDWLAAAREVMDCLTRSAEAASLPPPPWALN